ncbi:MAG: ATP-binding cassette domain-containing protein [Phycisphaerae bacterium]|nr:ATP-binding cassette domain-containing protein [Phycisphaerae bacterium]
MIRFSNVSKSFDGGATYAVRDLSLSVDAGQTLVLLGSSGCGKTTTLKAVNRLVEADKGTIEIDGRDIHDLDILQLRRSIGYVFQGIGLFPHMTVVQNISVVLKLGGRPRHEHRRKALSLLELVELDPAECADQYPRQLSGGQQQRVGVARALATDPDYLLMDEPFGALDALTRDSLQQEMIRLNHQLHKTVLFVTHDIFEALALGDRIGIMHEGRLHQVGTPHDVLMNPATDFVRDLFGRPRDQLAAFSEHLS